MSTENTDNITIARLENLKHIHEVRAYLYAMISELDKRARDHDASKLETPEAEIYGEHHHELALVKYGTPEYEALVQKVKPALDNHYAKNRHHPQHWPNGVDDMTIVDLVEMLCDWKASTQRNKDGNIRKSIAINAKRFKIGRQLTKIFQNTVREMFQE
jgi:hypothetical protein